MMEFLNVLGLLLLSAIRTSTPLILAAVGGSVCARSGVMAMGMEGFMLIAAFGAAWGSYAMQNAWLGLLVGKAVLAQGAEEQQALLDLQRQLLDLALQADDARVRQGAQTLLVSHYMAAGQPEKAEELLSAVPVPDTDPRLMLVSLYQAQGRGEEAEKLAQRLLYDQLCGQWGYCQPFAFGPGPGRRRFRRLLLRRHGCALPPF